MKNNYIVLKDNKEKLGWEFSNTKTISLDTGDYTLEGYENSLIIERKGSLTEFSQNIIQSRFVRELERMEGFVFPFVILEFTMEDILNFPANSGIPPYLWKKLRVNSHFILKKLLEFEMRYRTKFILAGNNGKTVASSLFNRIIEYYASGEKEK